MIQQHEVTIGSARYRVRELGSHDALKVVTRAFKIFGPSIAEAMRGVDTKGGKLAVGDLPVEAISNAIGDLSSRLGPDDLNYFVSVFATTTDYSEDGVRWLSLATDTLGLHFAGRLFSLFEWLTFCARVNFADFFSMFGRLGARASGAKVEGEQPSNSPNASSGGSIASQ